MTSAFLGAALLGLSAAVWIWIALPLFRSRHSVPPAALPHRPVRFSEPAAKGFERKVVRIDARRRTS